MDKVKQFFKYIQVAEDIWSIISILLQLGLGIGMIWLFIGISQLPQPIQALVFILLLVALVAVVLSVTRLILAFRHKIKLTRLYENRDELPPLIDDFAEAEEIWAVWRVGTTAKNLSQEIWDNPRFTRLLIHHPRPNKSIPNYLKAHMLGFPNRNIQEACQDIYSATRQAPKHVEVKWFNGYLGDSLLIVNPHNAKKKGWIRIEIAPPTSQGNDRPSIRVNEKQYPKLFRTLVANYETTFDMGEPPPKEYRQSQG